MQCVWTWIAGGGAGRAVDDSEGFCKDRRERKSVIETTVLNFTVDGSKTSGVKRLDVTVGQKQSSSGGH